MEGEEIGIWEGEVEETGERGRRSRRDGEGGRSEEDGEGGREERTWGEREMRTKVREGKMERGRKRGEGDGERGENKVLKTPAHMS